MTNEQQQEVLRDLDRIVANIKAKVSDLSGDAPRVTHCELYWYMEAIDALRAEVERLKLNSYPHMCQFGHERVGHSSSFEPEELSCPVCRAQSELADEVARLTKELAEAREKAKALDALEAWGAPEADSAVIEWLGGEGGVRITLSGKGQYVFEGYTPLSAAITAALAKAAREGTGT